MSRDIAGARVRIRRILHTGAGWARRCIAGSFAQELPELAQAGFHLSLDDTFFPAATSKEATPLIFEAPMEGGAFADFLQTETAVRTVEREAIHNDIFKTGAGEVSGDFDYEIWSLRLDIAPTRTRFTLSGAERHDALTILPPMRMPFYITKVLPDQLRRGGYEDALVDRGHERTWQLMLDYMVSIS